MNAEKSIIRCWFTENAKMFIKLSAGKQSDKLQYLIFQFGAIKYEVSTISNVYIMSIVL